MGFNMEIVCERCNEPMVQIEERKSLSDPYAGSATMPLSATKSGDSFGGEKVFQCKKCHRIKKIKEEHLL